MSQQEMSRPDAGRGEPGRGGRSGKREQRPRSSIRAPRRPERLAITSISPTVAVDPTAPPSVDGIEPAYAAKRVAGDIVEFSAVVVCDGAVEIGAQVRLTDPAGRRQQHPMTRQTGYRFVAEIPLNEVGRYTYVVEAWIDRAATIKSKIARKKLAGQPTENEEIELERLPEPFTDLVVSREEPIVVDRSLAAFAAWYELFPRSTGAGDGEHGTLRTCIDRLDYVASMGFDILYLPPIHPIGRSHRKGTNNSVDAAPDDVGSPWAIGAAEGGHTAIHPELGTFEDFDLLVRSAAERNLEIALDIAFQCSPDHPWVTEHPEWFQVRPDGSIAYAENPPKQYQDIVPFDFDCADWRALWTALADVVRFWRGHGVRVFRVDNPHTKPFPFWEWLIAELKADDPGIIFLAEAFAHPDVMKQLSRVGFSVSYTHFPWQHSPNDLQNYFDLLREGDSIEFFRGSAWVNTPDILTAELQQGLRQVFVARLVLAATLSACYGVYGPVFELEVADAVAPGSEEYLDGEKYQVRNWDLAKGQELRDLMDRLNEIRRHHSALQHDRTLVFHHCDNPRLVAYTKTRPHRVPDVNTSDDPILVVVNTDHYNPQDGYVRLDLRAAGLVTEDGAADITYEAHDLLTDQHFVWHGADNYVRLDPWFQPAHVFALRRIDFADQQRELT
jgi:starch synthase (maltosyl-transferring)